MISKIILKLVLAYSFILKDSNSTLFLGIKDGLIKMVPDGFHSLEITLEELQDGINSIFKIGNRVLATQNSNENRTAIINRFYLTSKNPKDRAQRYKIILSHSGHTKKEQPGQNNEFNSPESSEGSQKHQNIYLVQQNGKCFGYVGNDSNDFGTKNVGLTDCQDKKRTIKFNKVSNKGLEHDITTAGQFHNFEDNYYDPIVRMIQTGMGSPNQVVRDRALETSTFITALNSGENVKINKNVLEEELRGGIKKVSGALSENARKLSQIVIHIMAKMSIDSGSASHSGVQEESESMINKLMNQGIPEKNNPYMDFGTGKSNHELFLMKALSRAVKVANYYAATSALISQNTSRMVNSMTDMSSIGRQQMSMSLLAASTHARHSSNAMNSARSIVARIVKLNPVKASLVASITETAFSLMKAANEIHKVSQHASQYASPDNIKMLLNHAFTLSNMNVRNLTSSNPVDIERYYNNLTQRTNFLNKLLSDQKENYFSNTNNSSGRSN